jgi:hypothetical protein
VGGVARVPLFFKQYCIMHSNFWYWQRKILTFGLFGKRVLDWSVVKDYFRIGIKTAFFSLLFNLSHETALLVIDGLIFFLLLREREKEDFKMTTCRKLASKEGKKRLPSGFCYIFIYLTYQPIYIGLPSTFRHTNTWLLRCDQVALYCDSTSIPHHLANSIAQSLSLLDDLVMRL